MIAIFNAIASLLNDRRINQINHTFITINAYPRNAPISEHFNLCVKKETEARRHIMISNDKSTSTTLVIVVQISDVVKN